MVLTARKKPARAEVASHAANAASLCGTVTMMPSTFRVFRIVAMKLAKSTAATCIGMQIASTPRWANAAVTPAGDRTCAMGSPTIG